MDDAINRWGDNAVTTHAVAGRRSAAAALDDLRKLLLPKPKEEAMGSYNRVTLLGRLGADPQARMTNTGAQVVYFSLATNWRGQDGTEQTDWHRCSAFGRTGEIIMQYARKGDQVLVEGRLRYPSARDAHGVLRQWADINIQTVVLIGQKRGDAQEIVSGSPPPDVVPLPADQDDLPF